MNTKIELSELIASAWKELATAAGKKDWETTQESFRRMTVLQDMENRFSALEREVASAVTGAEPTAIPLETIETPQVGGRKQKTVRPRELRVGNHHIRISMNNQILIETAEWILKQGKRLPTIPNFVQTQASGFSKSSTTKQLSNGVLIEHGDSQPTLLRKARRLLDACGFQGLTIQVLLEDGTPLNA